MLYNTKSIVNTDVHMHVSFCGVNLRKSSYLNTMSGGNKIWKDPDFNIVQIVK